MIFTIGGIKGGGGKTTIALNLTIYLSKKGFDVLLVDADDQETATDFTNWRDENKQGDIGYTAVKLTGESVRSQVLKLSGKYDHVVIDTGGRDTTSQRAALSISDVYLIPFNPRSFDIWTLSKVEKLVAEVRAIKPDLQAFSFINRADAIGSDNEEVANLLRDSQVVPYLNTPVVNRKAFSNAAAFGLSVIELNPSDKKASAEINLLFDTVLQQVTEKV